MSRSPRKAAWFISALLLLGCGDSSTPAEPIEEPPPPTCADGEVQLPDGACLRPGMTAADCGEGFELSEVATCEPVLPPAACPPGQMAIPGDGACRPIVDCGDGRWGNIPVDDNTLFVDIAYTGDDNDGSEERPFTHPLHAMAVATSGALIAITDGVYPGYFKIEDRPLTLWGRCPERVELQGGVTAITAASVYPGGTGSVIRGVALSGPGAGVVVTGSVDVELRDLWVHDVANYGILIDSQLGPTAVSVEGSLIERATTNAFFIYGADAAIHRTEIRETALSPEGSSGQGISIRPCDTTEVCAKEVTLDLTSSVIDGSHDMGIVATGATVNIDGTVIRNTAPASASQQRGYGVHLIGCTADSCGEVVPTQGAIRRSLFVGNHEAGISLGSATYDVEAVVVRGTLAPPGNPLHARGLNIEKSCGGTECLDHPPSQVAVSTSVFEDHLNTSVFIAAESHVTFARSIVRRTYHAGEGISVALTAQPSCPGGLCFDGPPTVATIAESLIEDSSSYGLLATGSVVELRDSVVRGTWGVDGVDGDGVAAAGLGTAHELAVRNTLIDDTARAGLAIFGAQVAIEGTHIRCADIDINLEDVNGAGVINNLGDNVCGCPDATEECKPLSAGLAPPGAL